MRKSIQLGLGIGAAAVLAAAGIASANATPGGTTPVGPVAADVTTTAGTVSRAEAERIALDTVPGATVVESRLDNDGGRIVWNVHLSTANGVIEVKVDIRTGAARIDDDRDGGTATGGTTRDDATHDAGDDHGGNRGPGGGEDDGDGDGGDDDHGGPGRH